MAKGSKQGNGSDPFTFLHRDITANTMPVANVHFPPVDISEFLSRPESPPDRLLEACEYYDRQVEWYPDPDRDFWICSVVQAFSDRDAPPPSALVIALAYALGAATFVSRRLAAYRALLEEANQLSGNATRSVSKILTYAEIKERTYYDWKALPRYRELRDRAKELMLADAEVIVGAGGGIPYSCEEILGAGTSANWRATVDRFATNIIATIVLDNGRYPAVDLRRVVYALIHWHLEYEKVLTPVCVTAVAYALGLVNHSSGKLKARRSEVHLGEAFLRAAIEAGIREAKGLPALSQRQYSLKLDVSRATLRYWERSEDFRAAVQDHRSRT